jgi:3-phenylpropionate/cinnamic acid dioxygenase small subunit
MPKGRAASGEATGAGPQSAFADWLAIHDLLLRYARALDSRDWSLLRTCFWPDALARYGDSEVIGPQAIVDFCERALARYRITQHLLAAPYIVVDGDGATARTSLQATHVEPRPEGESLFVVAGTYHDKIVRERGEWRLAERWLETVWTDRRQAP